MEYREGGKEEAREGGRGGQRTKKAHVHDTIAGKMGNAGWMDGGRDGSREG